MAETYNRKPSSKQYTDYKNCFLQGIKALAIFCLNTHFVEGLSPGHGQKKFAESSRKNPINAKKSLH